MMPGQSDIVEGERTAIHAANIAAHPFKTVSSDENLDSVNKIEQDLDNPVEDDANNIEIEKISGKSTSKEIAPVKFQTFYKANRKQWCKQSLKQDVGKKGCLVKKQFKF